MRGRPRKNPQGGRTTSVLLEPSIQEAIIRLQLARFRQTGRKPTLRELIEEGIDLVLKAEGLDGTAREEHTVTPTVVTMTKKLS